MLLGQREQNFQEHRVGFQGNRQTVGLETLIINGNHCLVQSLVQLFKVKSLEPIVLQHLISKKEITIDVETFKDCFYIAYCRTVHKAQGITFKEAFGIHEWSKMDRKMRYTAISRATSKQNINVFDEDETTEEEELLQDTDFKKVNQRKKRMNRMKDGLYIKRMQSLSVINRIVRGSVSDEYCLKHTFKTKKELFEHLKIPNGVIYRGYEIDHIIPRRDHVTDEDFVRINAYDNLKLIPRKDNNKKH